MQTDFVPQSAQDFASGWSLAPHSVQCLAVFMSWPHCGQNLAWSPRPICAR